MPRRGDVWISSSPARRLAVCAGCEHDMVWTHACRLGCRADQRHVRRAQRL